MSMPSSSDDVATTAGSRPALSSSSTMSRCSRDTEPWCALATTISPAGCPEPDWAISCAGGLLADCRAMPARSLASSLSRAVSRSASRREFANTIVDRCASIRSSTRSSTCGQIEVRGCAPAAAPVRSPVGCAERGHVLDRHHDRRSNVLSTGGATTVTGRPPAEEGGDLVDRPDGRRQPDALGRLRRAGRRAARGDSARCAPRLVAQTACTSSTITVSTPRSASRAAEVSSRNSDSGVVIRMSAGCRAKRAALVGRGVAGSHGDRDVRHAAGPSRAAACRMPASGARRLRSTSTASALSGLT